MTLPDPVRAVVLGVVTETLRASGARGLLLHRPGTPEHDLVLRWVRAAGIAVQVGGLSDRGAAADDCEAADLIVTDPANKLTLLLEGPLPGVRLLPLGDLWPDGVTARMGGATIPVGFTDGAAEVAALAHALKAALDEGRGLGTLHDLLPADVAGRVKAALLRAAAWFRPPVVPKLTGWTPGIDPGL